MKRLILLMTLLPACVSLSACGSSNSDISVMIEDSYNEGYFDALGCVKAKGGSANSAARDCEDE